jgi:superfamily II DNA or RNA helicase
MILRDYQRKAIDSVLESYERGVRSGIVNLATGMGKSFLTTSLCQDFNQRYGGKTLFLVDQIDLD